MVEHFNFLFGEEGGGGRGGIQQSGFILIFKLGGLVPIQ